MLIISGHYPSLEADRRKIVDVSSLDSCNLLADALVDGGGRISINRGIGLFVGTVNKHVF